MKTRNLLLLLPAMSILAVAAMSCKPDPNQPLKDAVDGIFSSAFPSDGPGGAVLITRGGKTIIDKGYGVADITTGAAIDGDTFFNIASMSKQFTAVAIMQLAAEGKLSLDDSVHKYFPEYKADFWDRITIHHLLSHSSGIPDDRGSFSMERKLAATDTVSVSYLPDLDHLNFEPGAGYEYMNPTYVLLGMIVEKVSGQEFEAYMRDHLFTPAGMEHTLYYVPGRDAEIPAMAHAYDMNPADSLWFESDFGESSFFATRPDGGIYTSTHEFLAWEKALHSGAVLDRDALETAQSPKSFISDNPLRQYGYGWIIERRDNMPENIYHTGANGGFRTLGAYYPAADVEILVFTNRADFRWDQYKPVLEELMGI